MTANTHAHGGDLDFIEKTYYIAKDDIIDFSGNINPLGFPHSAQEALKDNLHIISTYPDKNYTSLRNAIGTYTGANPDYIVVGNGSTELISTFIQTVHAKNSIIIGPSYSEYEREISLSKGSYSYFPLKEEEDFQLNIPLLLASLTSTIGMLIICNPNNPTGSALTVDTLRKILSHCKTMEISVMIDETYIEFSDNINELCAIPLVIEFSNLFVIRGTSKFFAAPGIRLGYGISSYAPFLKMLKTRQNPWSVNHLAVFVGERIFSDTSFHKKTQTLISQERAKVFAEINTWKNCKVFPSSSNFILLKLLTNKVSVATLYEKCIQHKMVIRDAASFTFLDESYLRFCILSPKNNALLLQELKKWIEE